MPLVGDETPSPQPGRPDCGLLIMSDCAAGVDSDSCATTPTTDRLPYNSLRGKGDSSASSSEMSADGVVLEDGTVRVKQRLGLVSGTALIVGSMIGSGIFISPKGVIAGTGSVAASLIVWVACGIISLFGKMAAAPGPVRADWQRPVQSHLENTHRLCKYTPSHASHPQVPSLSLYYHQHIYNVGPLRVEATTRRRESPSGRTLHNTKEPLPCPFMRSCFLTRLFPFHQNKWACRYKQRLLVAFFAPYGALAYAELGTLITKSGAEYAYLLEAGKALPRSLAPIPAFLCSWVSVLVLKPCLFAVISLGFGIYVVEPFYPGCEPPPGIVKLVSILCICMVAAVNCHSVSLATRVQNFFTMAKLLAIALIVGGGFYKLTQGHTEYLSEGFEDSSHDVSAIALAFYDGLWAYDGCNLPRAIMIGIPLVTVCYFATNVAYLTVMSKEMLLESTAVAAV
ncbi:Y+l amino acid transporter 1 [Plakobranchus ocellatus]|uniref:Y+l amino acid transporter 1 n=1 Tax=Plakobranchus ocellatus TaxID=259542 RepID=A0AAV4C153_9GAST|nr:Y+l amino acid transporter 1 [Plakobranchus ocellatus]